MALQAVCNKLISSSNSSSNKTYLELETQRVLSPLLLPLVVGHVVVVVDVSRLVIVVAWSVAMVVVL